MRPHPLHVPWLPYLVTSIGVLFSLLIWYLLKYDVPAYLALHPVLESYHPWIILIFGVGLSVLVGVTIHIAQVARHQAISLKKINEDLKKEIGERINAEDIKQKLEVALLQGQKLQAMGTLAGGIAHDFNNILYAIIGYVEMAREDVEKDSLIHKNLGKVLDAAHRGQELVSRILSFSRRQHHEFSTLNLKKTIEAALALLRPTIPASVIIHFEAEADPAILGNQTQLHQVLVNLINNAVDAMDGEGTITIHLSHLPAADPYLKQFPATAAQNYCKIEIADTGHGMDKNTMGRIFEPFYTTKEVGKGTGLGLSIVHSIIKEHQGEITVTSRLGHGTTFVILLPEHS
ncbi:sensor histidine kinase [Aquicella lusitana]|uniref:histidine kinase n=1 Tax=Aquicella lusitana TaxID=254246 RepID=A0A370GRZ5_9COXI|nr:ATP-binding protein [Aquicella lusitana]RDI46026.1 phospho-acceptor domain-containing protein [Aquicella lusitana]VVC73377.1 Wide host range VirA protein [Aquicella lusitana]